MKSIKKISKEKLHELVDQLPEGETKEAGYIYEVMKSLFKKSKTKKHLIDVCRKPFIIVDKVEMPSREERNER